MTCNNTCLKYKVKQTGLKGVSAYKLGYKRCSKCGEKNGIFLDWLGIYCPCCGIRLGTKPKGTNGRANLVRNRI